LPGLHIRHLLCISVVVAVPFLLSSWWMEWLTLFHLSTRRGDLRRIFFGIWNWQDRNACWSCAGQRSGSCSRWSYCHWWNTLCSCQTYWWAHLVLYFFTVYTMSFHSYLNPFLS
jgi:hypothetical protein